MDNQSQTLSELSTLIAALKNPQCHYDLVYEDQLVLNIKLAELEELFYLIKNSGRDE